MTAFQDKVTALLAQGVPLADAITQAMQAMGSTVTTATGTHNSADVYTSVRGDFYVGANVPYAHAAWANIPIGNTSQMFYQTVMGLPDPASIPEGTQMIVTTGEIVGTGIGKESSSTGTALVILGLAGLIALLLSRRS